VPGCLVTIRETGIVLGSLLLEDEEWRVLRPTTVFSLRVDDHPALDGWATQHPVGSESRVEFEIPLTPVVVPPEALAHGRALSEWVMDTHGALGRLLIWDESRRWWMVHEPDLEVLVTCAPAGMFAEASEEPSWLSFGGTAKGRQELDELCTRYGVTAAE
jgi:hypothetical protein